MVNYFVYFHKNTIFNVIIEKEKYYMSAIIPNNLCSLCHSYAFYVILHPRHPELVSTTVPNNFMKKAAN